MKKRICIALLPALLALFLFGCAPQKAKGPFEADNEIFTYERIDPERTQIVVSRTGNIDVVEFCHAFEERNPDVQVIYLDITGGNDGYKPIADWITRGYVPDIVFSAADFFDEKLTPQYFENLSTHPVVADYEAAALKRTAIQDDVYVLPGPSNINAMMYNKTLFERYGWTAPKTFDEFVALCERIREDTNGEIEPWNPNAKYSQELLTALEGFTYEEIFGGADNRLWYNRFIAGEATFAGHMEPFMALIQTLVDHDLLREEHFSYSATTRGKEFVDGKIAMINGNLYAINNSEFDFGYMPFPTTKGDLGYLSDSYSCFVGLPVKAHTEAEQDAIERFLAFFSSSEGQQIYIGDAMKVSNVKDVPLNNSGDLAELQAAIDAGHLFAAMDFRRESGERRAVALHKDAIDITAGTMTGADCIAAVDALVQEAPEAAAAEAPEALATAEDMTILETSFWIADAYREAADAEIGLIANGEAYRGNVMRIFKGDLTANNVLVLKPRSFANDAALVKLSMTGAQLMDAMNRPAGYEQASNCIYAYAGLKCTVAPWEPLGEKYRSVKLADGTALDPARLYTVAAWAGTVPDDCITETLETYAGSWEELMTAKLKTDGSVKPANDGRIKLVWD